MENKPGRETPLLDGPISRRSLLKGLGGGALAVGASGLLEACSSKVKGSGTSSTDKIVIGFVTPQTGQLAGFASGDNFVVDRIRGTDAYTKGFKVGSKTYSVDILVKDSQSDPNRASRGRPRADPAGPCRPDRHELHARDDQPRRHDLRDAGRAVRVHRRAVAGVVLRPAGRPDEPGPVQVHDDVLLRGRGVRRLLRPHVEPDPDTNKVVGGMFPNDPDGNAFRDAWPAIIKEAGYQFVDGGAYTDGTTDYSSMISKFKSKDCQVFINAPLPPDFNTFWKQAAQQGYKPKLATVAKVLLFPADTEALGDLVNNIATDQWWGPTMPYTSSLDGRDRAGPGERVPERLRQPVAADARVDVLVVRGRAGRAHGVERPPRQGGRRRRAPEGELRRDVRAARLHQGTVPGIGIVNPVGVQWKPGTDYPWEMVVVDNSINASVPIGGDLVATNP